MSFHRRIHPFVDAELAQARRQRALGNSQAEFAHLERAHVLGQASTRAHVRVHMCMLLWALRQRQLPEVMGQVLRIVGAATKTAVGLVPAGNTGGTNISPFKTMPVAPDLEAILRRVKTSA